MSEHPYPEKIRQAIAQVLWPEMYVSSRAHDLADDVLTALWDASRVDSYKSLHDLPADAIVKGRAGPPVSPGRLIRHRRDSYGLPAHVIYYGGSDGPQ